LQERFKPVLPPKAYEVSDYTKIDVEGYELHVFKGIIPPDSHHQFREQSARFQGRNVRNIISFESDSATAP
jgi:hypothetical protein